MKKRNYWSFILKNIQYSFLFLKLGIRCLLRRVGRLLRGAVPVNGVRRLSSLGRLQRPAESRAVAGSRESATGCEGQSSAWSREKRGGRALVGKNRGECRPLPSTIAESNQISTTIFNICIANLLPQNHFLPPIFTEKHGWRTSSISAWLAHHGRTKPN